MKANGKVIKYGDNIDTDVIIPARYLNTTDHKELASHCMEDIDKEFVNKVKDGDIMVGGANFGCGSSREHSALVPFDFLNVKSYKPSHRGIVLPAATLPTLVYE